MSSSASLRKTAVPWCMSLNGHRRQQDFDQAVPRGDGVHGSLLRALDS